MNNNSVALKSCYQVLIDLRTQLEKSLLEKINICHQHLEHRCYINKYTQDYTIQLRELNNLLETVITKYFTLPLLESEINQRIILEVQARYNKYNTIYMNAILKGTAIPPNNALYRYLLDALKGVC